MVYTGNWVIIWYLPPIRGTRKLHWWYDCVTYTLSICSYVIYYSNCPHLACFFSRKSDLLVNICVSMEFMGWKENILCHCTNSRMVGCRIYSSSTRTWHEVVTSCLKMNRDRIRGFWNRKIFDEYTLLHGDNEQLYKSYIMSIIHHLNSDAFLISWYDMYIYIYIYNIKYYIHLFLLKPQLI